MHPLSLAMGHGVPKPEPDHQSTSPQTPRFLQTAEMVKPSTPSPSHESTSSSGSDEGTEYYPHLGERLSGPQGAGGGEKRANGRARQGSRELRGGREVPED